ncbi:hypothetical protein N8482_02675 [Chitinophagales bacterium]|nr:hypothetical protein [Chitinophagales bacterium]
MKNLCVVGESPLVEAFAERKTAINFVRRTEVIKQLDPEQLSEFDHYVVPIEMEHISGLEWMEHALKLNPTLKVELLTSVNIAELTLLGHELGCHKLHILPALANKNLGTIAPKS